MKLLPPEGIASGEVTTANGTYRITSKTKQIEVAASDVEDLKRIGWREPDSATTTTEATANDTAPTTGEG